MGAVITWSPPTMSAAPGSKTPLNRFPLLTVMVTACVPALTFSTVPRNVITASFTPSFPTPGLMKVRPSNPPRVMAPLVAVNCT